jgi:hypothetical protein
MNRIQPLSDTNTSEDGPDCEPNPGATMANVSTAGPPGPAPPPVPEPAPGRRSRFLEKVYYWVLSRS